MSKGLVAVITFGVLVALGSPGYAGVDPGDLCKDAKAKAAGKRAFDLLKALGKNIKKPNPGKLDSDISKAQSRLTKGFTKAEKKAAGHCRTSGDVDYLEATVDDFVIYVLSHLELSPSGAFLDATTGVLD
jgi:hypothetical protein